MSAQGSGVVVYLRPPGPPRACGLFARDEAPGEMSETVAWILRDLGVYALELSDDIPGFGLVMFGAIREHGIAKWCNDVREVLRMSIQTWPAKPRS